MDKAKYVERFKEIYRQKTGEELSDQLALEYFENLTLLVETITSHIPADQIVIPKRGSPEE